MSDTLTTALRRIVAVDAMKRAHDATRHAVDLSGDELAYKDALKVEMSAVRRGLGYACPPDTLIAQAQAWAAHCRAYGARFKVQQKTEDALRFSLAEDLLGLSIPSKLAGVAKHQGNVDVLAARLHRTGKAFPLQSRPVIDGVEIYGGRDGHGNYTFPLGRIQPKHRCWLGPLPRIRFAAICVTGGTEDRPLMGVNIAMEVWPVLTLPNPPGFDAAVDAAAQDDGDGRHIYGEVPVPKAAEPPPPEDRWKAIGGWDQ